MMTGWFRILGLFLLAGVLLSGCGGYKAYGFNFGDVQTIPEIEASMEENLGKRVLVKGYVRIDVDGIYLFEKLRGESTMLCLGSKIFHGDKGFHRKKVILSGLLELRKITEFQVCETYLTEINILRIE